MKQKIQNKKTQEISRKKIIFGFVKIASSLFFASVFLFSPLSFSSAQTTNCVQERANNAARVCNVSEINLTTNVLVNGSASNFIRAGVDASGKISFTIQVTLNQPADLIHGTDKIYFSGTTNTNATFQGFGATITNQDTSKNCGSITVSSLLGAGTSGTYAKCQSDGNVSGNFLGTFSPGKYDAFGNSTTGTIFKSGARVFEYTFTLTSADFAKYNLTNVNNGTDANSGLNQFYVVPNIKMGVNFVSDWTTITGAGKAIYVQLYKTTAEAQAADSSSTVPSCVGSQNTSGTTTPTCVPAYGSVTGSGKDISSSGGPIWWLMRQIINFALGLVQEFIYAVFFYFVAPFIQALLSIHPYTDAFVAVIYPGWEVIRNLCNMIFILALVVIALATLFRLESYNFRALLVQLIIAALMINFSLVIGQIILGLADTIQAQFLPANVTVIRSLAGNLMVNNWRDAFANSSGLFQSTGASFADIVQPLFFLIVSMGSFAVFCAIMAFLFIRIIALWVLLLVSPLAYAAGVLPATAGLRATWWQNFIKYAFFTPIMAFFLNMTAVIANKYTSAGNPIFRSLTEQTVRDSLGGSEIAAFVFKLSSNILLLLFLFAGLKIAEESGVIGAHGITSMAEKGMFAPLGAAAFGASKLGGYLNRRKREITAPWALENHSDGKLKSFAKAAGFAALNPDMVVTAFKHDSDKKSEAAKHFAEGAAFDFKRRIPGFKEENLPSEYAEMKRHYLEEVSKELPFSGNEALEVDVAKNLLKLAAEKGGERDKAKALAKILQLFEEKGGNALLESYGNNPDGTRKFDWSGEGVTAWLHQMVKDKSIDEQMAGEIRNRISKIGYETRQQVLYEGVNRHGVHPTLFKVFRDAKNQKWSIEGKADYEAIQNFAISKMEELLSNPESDEAKEMHARTVNIVDGKEVPLDPAAAESAKSFYRSELMGNIMRDLAKGDDHGKGKPGKYTEAFHHDLEELEFIGDTGTTVGYDHERFQNYADYQATMDQAASNISKIKDFAAILKDSHWNSVWDREKGVTYIQEPIIGALQDIKDDALFAAGRGMQPKTRQGMQAAYNNKDRLMSDLRSYLQRTYRSQGLDPRKLQKEIEQTVIEQYVRIGAILESANNGQAAGKSYLKTEINKLVDNNIIPASRRIVDEPKPPKP